MNVARSRSKVKQSASPTSKRHRNEDLPVTGRQTVPKPALSTRVSVVPLVPRRQRRARIRGGLGGCLQAEITALERARSVVDCLAAAMEAGATSGRGPYYPDVAHAASQMMTGTISRLSDLLLDSPEGLL